MFDETGVRSRSHGIPKCLIEDQARALGLDLLAPSAGWKNYEPVFIRALTELHGTGHEVAIFGDIALEPHREWEARVCGEAGIEACLPLWQRDTRQLAHESIALGFKAIVVCVDSRCLSDEFCGRSFDHSFVADLPEGVDACGENGEFHTFVYDGPLFAQSVRFTIEGRKEYISPPEFSCQRYCFAELAPTAATA